MATSRSTSVARPTGVEDFVQSIAREYEGLSRQLKVIARHVEQHRDHIGLDGIQELAARCGVQPSAVVRFAKHFGFSGFSEMQGLFRDGLANQIAPGRNYQARIQELIAAGSGALAPQDIARQFISGSIGAMEALVQGLDEVAFSRAVALLESADCIWIVASRRSFPVAVYLNYALQHTEKRVNLVSGLGSMQLGHMRSVRRGDVVLAISFAPYAEETLDCVTQATAQQARLIAITDSRMSPLARQAEVLLPVQDNHTFGFRSLSATMALAQGLFVALAYQSELHYQPTAPGAV